MPNTRETRAIAKRDLKSAMRSRRLAAAQNI